jgi:hypothetical protein
MEIILNAIHFILSHIILSKYLQMLTKRLLVIITTQGNPVSYTAKKVIVTNLR